MKPSEGRIVHFVNQPNTAFGQASKHCPAIITEVINVNTELVDLTVFPPRGQELFTRMDIPHDEETKKPGTWHWSEQVKE